MTPNFQVGFVEESYRGTVWAQTRLLVERLLQQARNGSFHM